MNNDELVPLFAPRAIRTVVVDDEPIARQRVTRLLSEAYSFEVVAEFGSARQAMADLPVLRPDLLFLDVEMPVVSGFELFEYVRHHVLPTPKVVFVTAHDEHAIRAFSEEAMDYLLKPFDVARFSRTLERAVRHMAGTLVSSGVESEPAPETPRSDPQGSLLAVRTKDGLRVLQVRDIDWAETAGNYQRLHVGTESFLFRATMQSFEDSFGGNVFARINRSTLVNVDRIRLLTPTYQGDFSITLADGTELEMRAQYRSRLRSLIHGFC